MLAPQPRLDGRLWLSLRGPHSSLWLVVLLGFLTQVFNETPMADVEMIFPEKSVGHKLAHVLRALLFTALMVLVLAVVLLGSQASTTDDDLAGNFINFEASVCTPTQIMHLVKGMMCPTSTTASDCIVRQFIHILMTLSTSYWHS